jgi:hypothetical protein
MKILFVENRYKTGFWEKVAEELIKDGHEIFWIVQNHLFKPKNGKVYLIPYPKKIQLTNVEKVESKEIIKIIQADRGLNYFKVKSPSYLFYYQQEIEKIVDKINPDIAFGETTLFHELLVSNTCKKRQILYLHPTSCRYPAGRISFYKYDTLEPFAGSGETVSDELALKIIDDIINRKALPDYMKVLKPRLNFIDNIKDKAKLSICYQFGERYNTPNPLVKFKIEKRKKTIIDKWESLASLQVSREEHLKVLYPLQMQPEANIDVWGYPNNNQTSVIKYIVSQLPEKCTLYIKPNPKSKYELTEELIDFACKEKSRVVLLSHKTKMNEVFPSIDFVVTVTGTISYECIWSGKPFVMFGQGIQTKYCKLKSGNLREVLMKSSREMEELLASRNEKIEFLKELLSTSYNAQVTDTKLGKDLIKNDEKFTDVIAAFRDILAKSCSTAIKY